MPPVGDVAAVAVGRELQCRVTDFSLYSHMIDDAVTVGVDSDVNGKGFLQMISSGSTTKC